MKLKYLILILASLSIQVWAAGDVLSNAPFMVSVGTQHACALDVNGVKCWGDNHFGQSKVPELKLPVQVSAGYLHTCALDAEGVKCWGNNEYGQTNVPVLKSPNQVVAGKAQSCAIDAEGVKCWGDNSYGQLNVPALKSPIQVTIGNVHLCALDTEGVKCWGYNYNGLLNVPELKSPTQISAADGHTCALDAEGFKCWGYNTEWIGYQRLKNPIQISTGQNHVCAVDLDGVKCWGSQIGIDKVPTFNSPVQVSIGDSYDTNTCVLDAEGVKCWGTRMFHMDEVPDLIFDIIKAGIPLVTSARAEYLKSITYDCSKTISESCYFALLISSSAIVSMDSKYFIETYLPNFKRVVEMNRKSLGYSGDIGAVSDSEKYRRLAIESIQSALSVSLNFISADSQSSIQNAIRAAGAASADPMNMQKIKDLVKQIDALSVEKQKLKSSLKSAFLVDSLELATNWLREKVK